MFDVCDLLIVVVGSRCGLLGVGGGCWVCVARCALFAVGCGCCLLGGVWCFLLVVMCCVLRVA